LLDACASAIDDRRLLNAPPDGANWLTHGRIRRSIKSIARTCSNCSELDSMTADPRLLDFNCPLCGSNNCRFVGIRRPNGTYFVTEFFQCAGCSVMFTNPAEFSRLTRDTFTGKWREREPMREYLPDSMFCRKKRSQIGLT
jgi:hypothetical protein